jgi:hypothetical protein
LEGRVLDVIHAIDRDEVELRVGHCWIPRELEYTCKQLGYASITGESATTDTKISRSRLLTSIWGLNPAHASL